MSKESEKALRTINEIADKSFAKIVKDNREINAVLDAEEKFCRDNNIPYFRYTRSKPKSSLPFLFYPILRNLIQAVVLIVGYVAVFAFLIWLIQSL